ncbi:hypothetical protein AO398_24585 [Methylobacterium sp. GXS13]|jgi:hypothetical protein|uniref:hypothetical protein n=1 Tax=Methylobacterium sp. GXS13 TaxID=1730094 RepID=UPI00071B9AC0|nr:hypothetical protein [Methylobacterium sp. GXS13]KST57621.1 hypothetical protein AO398_24585 [Methylobacterium sp. GXS13]
MIEEADANDKVVAFRLMASLCGFAKGLGLDEETTRHIVFRVITDMPICSDEKRLARARNWMLIASA